MYSPDEVIEMTQSTYTDLNNVYVTGGEVQCWGRPYLDTYSLVAIHKRVLLVQ